MTTENPTPSGDDEINALLRAELLDRAQMLLRRTSSAGLRFQVPYSDTYIFAGTRAWIAQQLVDHDLPDEQAGNTNIVQDVLDTFRACGFEVREGLNQFAITGSVDCAGILMESVLEHFGGVPEVFTIDKLTQMRATPGVKEDRAEETLRFETFTATRGEVIEAGIKALQDRTHPDFVDWRTLPGFGCAQRGKECDTGGAPAGVRPAPSSAEVTSDEARLYRDLTGDAMKLGFDGIPVALDALRAAHAGVAAGTMTPTGATIAPLDRDTIRAVFLAHGFTIKEGQTDLKSYVYEAAEALIAQSSTADKASEVRAAEEVSSATDDAMVRACRDLPELYEVRVELENGCGCVVWYEPDGTKHDIEGEGHLSDDINEAIDAALAHAAAPSTAGSGNTSALGDTGGEA